jgi:hypothetical protein
VLGMDETILLISIRKRKWAEGFCFQKDGNCIWDVQEDFVQGLYQEGDEPDFVNKYQMLAPYWENFKQYKLSEDA